ncbi:MAG: hypothetical protein ACHQ51_05115 [Elusimicrobiota bacterium]
MAGSWALWSALDRDERAQTHAAAAFALACACLWFLQPITGALVPADLGPRALGGRAGGELAAWAFLILAGPVLLHEAFLRLGSRARRAASFTALYGTYVAFCAADALARSAAPGRAGAWAFVLTAAGAWLLYGQLLGLHGLAPKRAVAGLAAALALWVLAPAGLARAFPRAVVSGLFDDVSRGIQAVSWPAELQPGGEGQTDAAPEYMKADGLLAGMDPGSPAIIKISQQLRKPAFDADAAREFDELLKKNAAALAAFRRAARLPFCDFNGGAKTIGFNNAFPNRFKPFRLSTLALLDARREQARGRPGSAVDDYVAALSMARHFARQTNARWMHAFCYRTIVQNAWPGLSLLLAEGKPARAERERLLAALRALEDSKPSLAAAVADEERRLELQAETVGPIEASVFSAPFRRSFQDARLVVFAREREAVVEAAERNRPELASRERDVAARDYGGTVSGGSLFESYAVCLADPKVAGRCWGEVNLLYSTDYGGPIVYQFIADAAVGVLAAAAAARVYESRHGTAPRTLADLVPGELSAVPADPFDGFRPLRYAVRRGEWTAYSVGPDRVDDGGRTAFDMSEEFGGRSRKQPPKGDLVVRVRF